MNYGDKPLTIPPQEGGEPETERSIRAVTEVGLPPLRGTEADITAAQEIRLDVLVAADDVLTQLRTAVQETDLGTMSANPPRVPISKDVVKSAQVALNSLRHQDDAAWWLSHRDESPRVLLQLFMEGHTLPPPDNVI